MRENKRKLKKVIRDTNKVRRAMGAPEMRVASSTKEEITEHVHRAIREYFASGAFSSDIYSWGSAARKVSLTLAVNGELFVIKIYKTKEKN